MMTSDRSRRSAGTVLSLSLALLYAFVTYLVADLRLAGFDLRATRSLQTLSFLPLDYTSSILSLLGAVELTVPLSLLGAFLLYRKGHSRTALGLLVLLVLVPLVLIFKTLIAQRGPDEVLHRYTFTFLFPSARASSAFFSFPSGHVTRGVFLCGYAGFLVWRYQSSVLKKYLLLVALGCVALLVGLTRVYSGEHWSSDVIGGFLLGSLAVCLAISVARGDDRPDAEPESRGGYR